MPKTCTRDQIRELDRRAIEDCGIPGIVLMENAGRGAAQVAADMLEGKRVVIFCGKGNNGGDGLVIARHLHNRRADVKVVLAFPPDQPHPETDLAVNLNIIRNMPIPLQVADSDETRLTAAAWSKEADLVVDALLGTGLTGEVRDPYLSLIRLINAADKPVLAVDIPSGLDADTGRVLRAAVRAKTTATMVLPKRGFYQEEGPAHTGNVIVVDIGLPRELLEELPD